MSAALRAVAKEQYVFGQRRSDFFQRRHGARNVGCRRYDDELRVFAQKRFDVFRADVAALGKRTDVVRNHAELFQPFQRAQHGIVFQRGGDNVIAFFQRAENKRVERFGAAFGENDAFGRGRVENVGKQFARF